MADELQTIEVKGVEILRTGTFTGQAGGRQTYTVADLDEFAAAPAALVEGGHYPTVYLGHTAPGMDEPPAVGRITGLTVKGDRLVADLSDVPPVVAKLMAAKAYPARSIEGLRLSWGRALEIGGRKYRQVLTGLALLGKSLPAVAGLADIEALYASATAADDWTDVPLALARKDEDPLETMLAALAEWEDTAMELIRGRKYAPAIRQRLRMLRDDFRRIAGGTTRVEASMTDDSNAADARLALAATDPATALAVISEILGMPDADLAAIVTRIRELAGTGTAPDSALEASEDTAMQNASPAGDSSLVQLQAEHSDLLRRLATIEGERARDAAAADVHAAIEAGKAVPAQRETLMKMALSSPTDFRAFIAAAPAVVKLGERGTSAGVDAAAFEPSADAVAVAMKMGLSPDAAADMLRRENARKAGVTLPQQEG